MKYGWDDIVWCDVQRRYLWRNGTKTRVIKGVELDANEAVKS